MEIAYIYPSQNPRLDAAVSGAPDVYDAGGSLFGKDGLTFKDLLDTVNPLQQLPIIGSIYRELSGDTISTASRLAGGALIGGPIGLLAAAVNSGIEAITGGDI